MNIKEIRQITNEAVGEMLRARRQSALTVSDEAGEEELNRMVKTCERAVIDEAHKGRYSCQVDVPYKFDSPAHVALKAKIDESWSGFTVKYAPSGVSQESDTNKNCFVRIDVSWTAVYADEYTEY
jgi:hypothetical protein